MKILFLAPNVNIKARTGDAVHVRELAINLAQLGNNVSLVAGYSSDQPDELKPLLNHPNINFTFNKNLFKIRFLRLNELSTILTCLKLACKNPLDVIYERCFSCKIGTIMSKILRKPLVVEVNGLADEEAELQGTLADHMLTKNIRIRLRKFFFESSNIIVAVTQGIKEELQRKYYISPDKIAVISNGVNTELFKPIDQKSVKDELGLNHEHRYVCFVGKLVPWQGVEYLIQASPLVLKKVPEARFLIVGDGMTRNKLEYLVHELGLENYIIFTGNVPYKNIPKYINASDVCVAPFIRARNEKIGLSPLKIYEYMACGKPVVASNIKGVGDILEKSDRGIAVTPEKPQLYADAIMTLLQNEGLRIQMGKKGREYVAENHSWEIVTKNIVNVCEYARKRSQLC